MRVPFMPCTAADLVRIACCALAALAGCASGGAPSPVASRPVAETATDPYVISVSRPEGGVITAADGQIDCGPRGSAHNACSPVRYESTVTFTATAEPGFRFTGWAADCAGTQPTCTIDTRRSRADKWVAAGFEPAAAYSGTYFRVTVTRPTGGTVTSADGQLRCGTAANANVCGPVLYRWGDVAGLTAAPDAGYRFDGWSGDCSGTGRCMLTTRPQASDKAVGAAFSR